MSVTLSEYYPEGTAYFYGYPAGQDSGFFNTVPPQVEELVAGRPLRCLGDRVKAVAFAASVSTDIRRLFDTIGTPLPSPDRIIALPDDINADLSGPLRNDRIREMIKKCIQKESLCMAQPYTGDDIEDRYAIPTGLCAALNDKSAMSEIIPPRYLAARLAQFEDGASFASSSFSELPCVVKVASSSAGDGVRICKTPPELASARRDFTEISQRILIEEFVEAADSVGVQFAVPADPSKPVQVLGCSRQCLAAGSESIGGLVMRDPTVPANIERALLADILPNVRSRGWYGVGGMDVLIASEEECRFVDPNFRMTAMTPFVWQARNDELGGKNQLSFNSALFTGELSDLLNVASLDSGGRLLNIISATRTVAGYRLCGSVLFDQSETLRENASELKKKGLTAASLGGLS